MEDSVGAHRHGVCGPSMTNSGLPPEPPRDNTRARTQKYTWSQLNQFVRANHQNYSSVNFRVPSAFTFAEVTSNQPVPPTANGSSEERGQGESSVDAEQPSNVNKTHERLYYLGHNEFSREQTIQYIDLPDVNIKDWSKLPGFPQPRSLLGSWIDGSAPFSSSRGAKNWNFPAFNTRYSQQPKEEQLIRERKRLPSIGITQFESDPKCETIVFLNSKALYHCRPRAKERLSPTLNSLTRPHGAPSYPSVCPSNSDLLAFISHRDIYVYYTKFSYPEVRLTFTYKHPKSPHCFAFFDSEDSSPDALFQESHSLSAGVPSFVAQEEFDRYVGYWWQPEATVYIEEDGTECALYKIVYEEVDESKVDIVNIQNPLTSKCDAYRYPKAGSINAKSSLRLLTFAVNHNNGAIRLVSDVDGTREIEACVPDAEYLVRCDWCPSGKYFWSQWLSRSQTKLFIVLSSLGAFYAEDAQYAPANWDELEAEENEEKNKLKASNYQESGPHDIPMEETIAIAQRNRTKKQQLWRQIFNSKEKLTQKIFEESSEIWINVHDIMHVISNESNDDVISFIFASQQTNFRHLYYIQTKLGEAQSEAHDHCLAIPLTSGDWEVLGKCIWVDEERHLVYFLGLKESELEAQLYVCSYRHPQLGIFRLTQLGFYHSVFFNRACTMFVDSFSSLNVPPALALYRMSPDLLNKEADNAEWFQQLSDGFQLSANQYKLSVPQYPQELHVSELFSFKSSQSKYTLHGLLHKPDNFQMGVKYPCLLYVYAGPQVQIVNNSFKGLQFLRLHSLLAIGFSVVVIDGRGSANRGLEFEGCIKNALGTVEVTDQLEGLEYIAKKSGCIDLSRVAIHGWSYGGYISLLALAQNPCKFMCAAAAAPVVNWREYDTGYTERYLGIPELNMSAYGSSSVLNYIQHFPNEANRLLIIHGAIDENVHYRHTALLVNALIMNCKPFSQITYPMERHGLRHTEASEHFETSLLHFFNSNA